MATEKNLERAHAKWAKMKGWKVKKITGDRGTFDRIYIKGGVTCWIEWKQPGGRLSHHQEVEYEDLIEHNAYANVFDNLEDAKTWLNHLDPANRPKTIAYDYSRGEDHTVIIAESIKNELIDNVTLKN